MRKISANLIFPVSSPPLRNGIILINPDGSIADLVDTGGILHEESGLEYYPGTITPGFVLPWFCFEKYLQTRKPLTPADTADIAVQFEKLDRDLFRHGIKGIGLVLRERMVSNEGFERMSKSSLLFHPVIELCPGRDDDAFEVFNRGIDLVSRAWNEFKLHCSLTACSPVRKNSDIRKLLDEYGRSHMNLLPPEGEKYQSGKPSDFKDTSISISSFPGPFNILFAYGQLFPALSFEELVAKITLESALKIFEEDELGSIEKGKKPGLNLVSGYAGEDSGRVSHRFSKIAVKVLI